ASSCVVESLLLQTLRGAASPSEARRSISDRLIAVARGHDVLSREAWEGAELRGALEERLGRGPARAPRRSARALRGTWPFHAKRASGAAAPDPVACDSAGGPRAHDQRR